jgi:hypothetical protein
MLRALVIVMGLFGAAHAAHANQHNGSNYFSIVPSNWHLLPEDGQTHERRFVSPSGDAWLSLYARPPSESIEAHLEAVKQGEHERVTYERAGRTWIVVSGYKGDRIFYRKAILACGGRSWHHLEFEYPAKQKLAFDQFVTRASYALKEYNQIGCPESEG